jgi:hypothetical protein
VDAGEAEASAIDRTSGTRSGERVVTDRAFRICISVAFLAAAVVIVRVRFYPDVELPRLPRRPVPVRDTVMVAAATKAIERDPVAYADLLAGDSRELHIDPIVTPDQLAAVFPHRVDEQRRVLASGRKRAEVEVLGLALSLAVADVEGSPRRQMVLTIENRTSDHLAYRVVTQSSRGLQPCLAKTDLAHNAIALAPGEKVRRSECIYRDRLDLFVDRVETIALPRLSYYYVSSLPAAAIGLERPDRLAARGHRAAGGRSPCRVFHSAEVGSAVANGSATWRDLVDFYARHPCGVYTFAIDYKAFDKPGERSLPAVPPSVSSP